MTEEGGLGHLWIIGPGRLGLALGGELHTSAVVTSLTFTGRRAHPPAHPLFARGGVSYQQVGHFPTVEPSLLFICVPDDAIRQVALGVLDYDLPPSTVLHTSGVAGSELLAPLREAGWQTGSFHPLVAVPGGVDTGGLRGAWFGVEATPAALDVARRIVDTLAGHVLEISPGGKASYHAAAVFASNYLVTLLDRAVGLMGDAGVCADDATLALTSLARGAVANVEGVGSLQALTGPILRGDAGTVEQHLARLSEDDRALYSVLAREALRMARARGLPADRADQIVGILEAERT